MRLIFLLLLATFLLMGGCHVQKDSKNSGKVPRKTGKVPTKTGEVPKNSGKVPTKTGEVPTNHSAKNKGKAPSEPGKMPFQKILGKEKDEQLRVVIEGLKKKQCLLETVFYPKNSKDAFRSNEYEFFKNRRSEIYQNDPALSQLLEGLFAVALKAKKPVKKDGTKKSARLNALKLSLAYAVNFMAKRGKISLESPRGETETEPKAILIELIDLYNELQLDIEKAIKNCQKSDQKEKRKNEQKGKKENGQKEQRFLRFVARSLEIEWDANAFLGGLKEDEDGN
ncbi:hypothetical protein niasHT_018618 [Heterodera trifolii]|uniref:Lipoprotein n=1 Tax=Heterodera trifolii TaxID=157864 RepID=A0ABD2KZ12_9BILA